MSGGGVAAIVIVTLLLIGGSVAGYFVYKKKDIIRWRQFSYARQGRRTTFSAVVRFHVINIRIHYGSSTKVSCTGPGKRMAPRLREFFKQGQAEVISNSKNKTIATWEPFFLPGAVHVSVIARV